MRLDDPVTGDDGEAAVPYASGSAASIPADELAWPDVAHQVSGQLAEAHQISPAEARAQLRAAAQHPDGRLDVAELTELADRVQRRETDLPPESR